VRVPANTYRLQLNAGFRLADARALADYLHALGITDLYASPILAARRGSVHGYDVTDPTHINPELGTEADFRALAATLRERYMGLVVDIVPNHMAASLENPWWRDVLENGRASPHARAFDIYWDRHILSATEQGRLLLLILGDLYGNVLENGQFTLHLDERGFSVRYYERDFPLEPKSYDIVLTAPTNDGSLPTQEHEGLRGLLSDIQRLPAHTVTEALQQRRRAAAVDAIKRRLWELYTTDSDAKRLLDQAIQTVNGVVGDPASFNTLDALLRGQPYRLAFWRLASQEINYRRFFDVNDLVGLRVEDLRVFEATHGLILRFVGEGLITGLRIDHVDGLWDPIAYLQRLQERATPEAGERFYVVVEKIVSGDEGLRADWPVSGTTGYDFLNVVNAPFIDSAGLADLTAFYNKAAGSDTPFEDVVYAQKRRVLLRSFQSEVQALGRQLATLAQNDRYACDVPRQDLIEALVGVTACMPVYRTYIRDGAVSEQDRTVIDAAFQEARRRSPGLSPVALDFLRRVLTLDLPAPAASQKLLESWLAFVMGWQQLTGPAMAKGLEDTALYVYNPLISLNNVGGGPEYVARTGDIDAFHRANAVRLAHWPHTLNATTTHDTKRSEDVRARADVLSELPDVWRSYVERWQRANADKKRLVRAQPVPSGNEEMLLYQSLVSAWPLDAQEVASFRDRFKGFMLKVVREGKVHTSWTDQDPEYEDALQAFIDAIFKDGPGGNASLPGFLPLQRRIAYHGALNSLAQVALKVVSPGVPDFYRGTELWDLSLVDPDNRRPVDFELRARLLEEARSQEGDGLLPFVEEILISWEDGRIKLYLTYKLLDFRRRHPDLFTEGEYLPLRSLGVRARNVIGLARRRADQWLVVAVPRFTTELTSPGQPPIGKEVWGDTALGLPEGGPGQWRNVLTGETIQASPYGASQPPVLLMQDALRRFPVGLLVSGSDL
jgi:(1->4)-alpha-D-glucan 1-alpha-D-glucosylmutase